MPGWRPWKRSRQSGDTGEPEAAEPPFDDGAASDADLAAGGVPEIPPTATSAASELVMPAPASPARGARDECAPLRRAFANALEGVVTARLAAEKASAADKEGADAALEHARATLNDAEAALDECEKQRRDR